MSLRPIRIRPAILALLLQFAAFVLALLVVRLSGLQPMPLAFALFCGALAAILSRIAGLAFWWLLIQFAFAPALVLMLALSIPPAFFLVAFLWYRKNLPLPVVLTASFTAWGLAAAIHQWWLR